ncbi:CPBP family intramembrane glutamic endopeptidase [Anoxybacteroides amylolyticum]|uniref:CPBP family intramembrane glutamic endopeptidase n=1 Tax=Anoxybacteroides amylolyticum TaxID=294699 RepID=UPI000831EC58|nr:type II CAAX endopeptidase family protein [Anoxybacillus amylolyticus]
MKRQYWYIIIAYIMMQLSSIPGVPLLRLSGIGGESNTAAEAASGYWAVISFTLTLFLVLFWLRDDMKQRHTRDRAPLAIAWLWAIGGFFLALISQSVAANIEWRIFGIEMGSENTKRIVDIIRLTPALVIVTSVIGPILEEVIFRKIIFGTLYQKYNFFIAATISSLLFAAVHMELEHLLLYWAMGFTFAFLYAKTRRIFVSIFAHVTMNTFVVAMQTIFADHIEPIMHHAEKVQVIFGGF